MSASVVEIEKPVVIDRKQNLREHRLYWVGRRMQDVVLSALALVVLSPVMLATAIAIVVDDPSDCRTGNHSSRNSISGTAAFDRVTGTAVFCTEAGREEWSVFQDL